MLLGSPLGCFITTEKQVEAAYQDQNKLLERLEAEAAKVGQQDIAAAATVALGFVVDALQASLIVPPTSHGRQHLP